jgi:hypothetical protein
VFEEQTGEICAGQKEAGIMQHMATAGNNAQQPMQCMAGKGKWEASGDRQKFLEITN